MKATCEVVVEREALLTAVSIVHGPFTLLGPDDLEIGAHANGIVVTTASLQAELKALGVWDRRILVSLSLVEELLLKNDKPTTKLLYVGDTLFVDRLPVAARDLGAVEPFGSKAPPRWMGPAHQRALYLPDPTSGKLRLARTQMPPRGLPLFPERKALPFDSRLRNGEPKRDAG